MNFSSFALTTSIFIPNATYMQQIYTTERELYLYEDTINFCLQQFHFSRYVLKKNISCKNAFHHEQENISQAIHTLQMTSSVTLVNSLAIATSVDPSANCSSFSTKVAALALNADMESFNCLVSRIFKIATVKQPTDVWYYSYSNPR